MLFGSKGKRIYGFYECPCTSAHSGNKSETNHRKGLLLFFVIKFVEFSTIIFRSALDHALISVNVDAEIPVEFQDAFKDTGLLFDSSIRYI